jgi:hypothetical protein
MQWGPVCHQTKQGYFSAQLSHSVVYNGATGFSYEWDDNSNIYDVWPKLIVDEERVQLIINDVLTVLDEGRFPLILTERREHLNRLSELLKDKADFVATLYGGLKKKSAHDIFKKLKKNSEYSRKVILATDIVTRYSFRQIYFLLLNFITISLISVILIFLPNAIQWASENVVEKNTFLYS